MDNEKLDVFDRAWLFLARAVYEQNGLDATFRIVRVDKAQEEAAG